MTTVKFIHSAMAGAPALSGSIGTMIAVLDAALVNGFGSGVADSVVISGGIATVTRSAGHSADVDAVVEISGATVTGGSINGQQKVLSVAGPSYTFAAPGIPNQTATGTITQKIAPLGFSKAFSGTNKAAYRIIDPAGTGCYLRVDDSGPNSARAIGYETMTDVDTGSGLFPTNASVPGGFYWARSSTTDSTAREWVIVGDSRFFVLHVVTTPAASLQRVCFGDFVSVRGSDPYGCTINGYTGNSPGTSPGSTGGGDLAYIHGISAMVNQQIARAHFQTGSAIQALRNAAIPMGGNGGTYSGIAGSTNLIGYPNATDNGIYVAPYYLGEIVSSYPQIRGVIPGIYYCVNSLSAGTFNNRDVVDNVATLPGRRLRALCFSGGSPTVIFADVTGPWR